MMNQQLRQDALAIFQAGLEAANPAKAMERHLRLKDGDLRVGDRWFSLEDFHRILLVGMGKASALMAESLTVLLGDGVSGGVINVKYGHGRSLPGIEVVEAGHPIPDANGVRGTHRMIELLHGLTKDDLVFCLLSGGGSSLSPAPARGLSLEDKQEVTQKLLACGAGIEEINTIRKHLSRIKGGQLARLSAPATVVSLVLSDVIGDDLSTIASGPTVPDPTTYGDCLEILGAYGLTRLVPPPALRHLEAGARGEIPETPKAGDPVFSSTENLIVGSNQLALDAARQRAADLGYHPMILSSTMAGETREVARFHAALAQKILETGHPIPAPACLISGGETTVTLKGKGKGGRNQEFVLAAALSLEDVDGLLILSAGTDGTDGPTDAAGALADGSTVGRGRDLGMEASSHLAENDAYPFFDALGDLIRTGPTLTNVMDLRLVLVA